MIYCTRNHMNPIYFSNKWHPVPIFFCPRGRSPAVVSLLHRASERLLPAARGGFGARGGDGGRISCWRTYPRFDMAIFIGKMMKGQDTTQIHRYKETKKQRKQRNQQASKKRVERSKLEFQIASNSFDPSCFCQQNQVFDYPLVN